MHDVLKYKMEEIKINLYMIVKYMIWLITTQTIHFYDVTNKMDVNK